MAWVGIRAPATLLTQMLGLLLDLVCLSLARISVLDSPLQKCPLFSLL